MKKSYWVEARQRRLLVVLVVIAVYVLLMVTDGIRFFPQNGTNSLAFTIRCIRFGFSALVSALFLAVGAFTWLYARDRRVATLLFLFTLASMVSIAVQTAAIQGDSLYSNIGGASSAISLLPLFALLLFFPHSTLFSSSGAGRQKRRGLRGWDMFLVPGLLTLFSVLSGLTVVDYVYRYTQPGHVPEWLEVVGNIYFPLLLLSILITICLSFFRSRSPRERQQMRFFLVGIFLAFVPLLFLTILPVVTAHPEYAVDVQISSLFYFALPLSLCYAVIRQQVLLYETTIRRTVAWITGIISVGVLGYVIVVGINIALADHLSLAVLYIGVGCALVLSPCLWWLASFGTERLLLPGNRGGYHQFLGTVTPSTDQKFDLEQVAERLVSAAQKTFETEEACLFVRGADAFTYRLYPALAQEANNTARRLLMQRLHPVLEVQEQQPSVHRVSQMVVKQLLSSRRPLLLNDLTRADNEGIGRVSYYLNTSSSQEDGSVLFAPIWERGDMIAIMVLGKRADQQPYGGPDFDVVQLLFTQYASGLETARVTDELRAAYERQKELDMLKDQFIMTASHELRTPLTAVLGYIELLAEHNEILTPERRASFIQKAHHGCDELTLMVNNIMDANRVQVDVESTEIAPFLLEESVVHVVQILESVAKIEHRTISLSVPSTLSVMADAIRLRQVLLNLVGNALKYSPPGTPVEISAQAGTEYATICIRDYGAGVPPEEHNRLFERFVRLERDMNSPMRGTGLGLYISRRLVQAMGGKIWIESTGVEGEGSSFVFTLPLAPLP